MKRYCKMVLAIALICFVLCSFVACGNSSKGTTGVFYAYENGVLQTGKWIKLDGKTWSNSDGLSGELKSKKGVQYAYSDGNVLFYGTVENGVFHYTYDGNTYYDYYAQSPDALPDGTTEIKFVTKYQWRDDWLDVSLDIDQGSASDDELNSLYDDAVEEYIKLHPNVVDEDISDYGDIAEELMEFINTRYGTIDIVIPEKHEGKDVEKVEVDIPFINTLSITKNVNNILIGSVYTGIINVAADNPYLTYTSGCVVRNEDKKLLCTARNFELPDDIKIIGRFALYYAHKEEIIIPNGVTTIEGEAFVRTYCKKVTIPDSVTTIEQYAFYGCLKLESVMIGNGVTSIGDHSFCYCTSLTSITIPDSVTSIGYAAFDNCSGLTSVYYTGDIASWCGIIFEDESYHDVHDDYYGAYNLYLNNELVTDLVIPNTVTRLNDRTFAKVKGIKSVTIPASVTYIGKDAFALACEEEEDFSGYLLNKVYYGGDIASWCGITFDDNPLSIAGNLYVNNELVTNVVIPDSVTAINGRAFDGYKGASITIPDSVTDIGEYAFSECEASIVWGGSPVISTIKSHAFANYRGELTIPDSVTTIQENAFEWCSAAINWGDDPAITTIGAYAFNKYSGKQIIIPGTVTSIGEYAFAASYVDRTESITIPDSVISIGEYAFQNRTAAIIWGDNPSITTIGRHAFAQYGGNDFSIPESVTALESGAFAYYKGDMIDIPDSVISIDKDAFYGSHITLGISADRIINGISGVSSLVITDGTTINAKAFQNNTSLVSITIADSITSIGDYAFENCVNLTTVTIGSGVRSVGELAFGKCFALTDLYYKGSFASWCRINFEFASDYSPSDYEHYYDEYNRTIPTGEAYYHYLFNWSESDFEWYKERVEYLSNPMFYAKNFYINDQAVTNFVIPDEITDGKNLDEIIMGDFIKTVTIGTGLREFDEYAFDNCRCLTAVDVADGNPNYCSVDGVLFNKDKTVLIYYPEGRTDTSYTVPDTVTEIGDYSFERADSLTNVTIGENVDTIGDSAFFDCSSLISFTYNGTIEDWNDIDKYVETYHDGVWRWDDGTADYIVHCTDGNIRKGS